MIKLFFQEKKKKSLGLIYIMAILGKPRRDPRRATRKATAKAAAKKTTRKVDVGQNHMIKDLTKRLKKLEHVTIERKYLTMHDAFNFGGLGAVKSRCIHRYELGTYDGCTTSALFGTTGANGDQVYARYMIVDVNVQCQNPDVAIGDEISPTNFALWILKPRKENDAGNAIGASLWQTNALNDPDIISNNVPGQSFVNPKGWKIVKQKVGMIGGVKQSDGFGIAHRRYRFTIPINKKVNLQRAPQSDEVYRYPTEFQDWLWFAICANGSVADGNEPHCSFSAMLCYDDAGDN